MESSFRRRTKCPVCQSEKIQPVFSALDYTVSGQSFDIWECQECTLRFTQGVPKEHEIQDYYRSDNYISHTETTKGLINRLYHMVRRRTLEDKRKLLVSETGGKMGRLLDIGAGTGAFAHHMEIHGWKVTGLEPDPMARERAAVVHQINLEPVDRLALEKPDSYDAITLWHVLEHVHELHGYMEQLKNLVKPGGKIFIAVPNYTSYDAAVYKGFWAAYDVPRHLYHFSPGSMNWLLQLHGLRLVSKHPMWFDAYYISLLSEKYKKAKGQALKGFWTGALSNIHTMAHKDRCSSLIYVAAK
jgi:2-polyprenyl-3-methyl-5-hydroxy-6-metoxy-1,4-benzoquinol methylase